MQVLKQMSEVDDLFASIPERPRVPQVLSSELNLGAELANAAATNVGSVSPAVKEPKHFDVWSLLVQRKDLWILGAVLLIAIIYLLYRNSKEEDKHQEEAADDLSLVDKVRAAAAAASVQDDAPRLEEAPQAPRLHPNSVVTASVPVKQVSKDDPASMRELGAWLRSGLQERGVSPAATTQIVTVAIRSIMAEGEEQSQKQQVRVQEPKKAILDVRGQPIPVEASTVQTEAGGEKQGKINAETDPRLIAMMKAREQQQQQQQQQV